MAKRKVYSRRELPPCPDPGLYMLIKKEEGYYWRRKRGTVKKAMLNPVLAKNAVVAKITGPATSRILKRLRPFTHGLKTGSVHLTINNKLIKAYYEKETIDFRLLKELELNAKHPLEKILLCRYRVTTSDDLLHINIPLQKESVYKHNNLVTNYYFDAVLLWGDARNDEELYLRHVSSALYSFENDHPAPCELELPRPPGNKPWMLLLKLSCLEGNELAAHPKHYGMKVVSVNESN